MVPSLSRSLFRNNKASVSPLKPAVKHFPSKISTQRKAKTDGIGQESGKFEDQSIYDRRVKPSVAKSFLR